MSKQKSYTTMTADEYTALINLCFPGQSKARTAQAMQITEVTHTKWLKRGIVANYKPTEADKNKAHVLNRVESYANSLHNRSRSIEAWLAENAGKRGQP